MNGRGIAFWGTLAVFALVASPLSRMIGDPVHSVWLIGLAALLLGLGAILRTGSQRT